MKHTVRIVFGCSGDVQQHGRQFEIRDQRDGVDQRRDEGRCHDGRVEAGPVCQHRQRTADDLRDEDHEDQRQTDDEGHHENQLVDQEKLDEVGSRQREAAEDRYADLLPDDPQYIAEFHIAQGKGADDGDARLGTGVAAGVHEHRDVGGQDHERGERVLELRDDGAGDILSDFNLAIAITV